MISKFKLLQLPSCPHMTTRRREPSLSGASSVLHTRIKLCHAQTGHDSAHGVVAGIIVFGMSECNVDLCMRYAGKLY